MAKYTLEGRVVVITGGARGIGRATAAAFISAGAFVAIGDINVELAEKAAAELGEQAVGLPLDVTDRKSFATFLDQAEASFGPLDVLVNNAGIMPTGLLSDELDQMTDRMIAINLRAVITGSKLAAARLSGRGGSIVNVASLAAVLPAPALATYTATKAAVLMFTDSLRCELSNDSVHLMTVLPGVVRTELSAGLNAPSWLEPIITVDPEDIAAGIVAGVTQQRRRITVPRTLGWLIKFGTALPQGPRQRLEHRLGLDTAYTKADPAARDHYHRRLNGDVA